jgi:RimJ/RimL family protein N-acetyltransferase
MQHICEADAIDTARLRLRPMQLGDVAAAHALWTERTLRLVLWDDAHVDPAQSQAVIERSVELYQSSGLGLWCAYVREEDLMIGFCGLWTLDGVPEPLLLYGVSSVHAHRGYAPEMLRAFLPHVFGMGIPRVVMHVPDERNRRLAAKLGFAPARRENVGGWLAVLYAAGPEALPRSAASAPPSAPPRC